MPHCIVEYSQDLTAKVTAKTLNQLVFEAAWQSTLFTKEEDIKVRSIEYTDYQIGRTKGEFIHVLLKIMKGRTLEQKMQLTGRVVNQLKGLGLTDVSLTAEVVEIDTDSYAKIIL